MLDYERFRELDFGDLVYTCGAGAAVQPNVAMRWRELTGCALSGGYPNEIERVVAGHPDVCECACIGVQDSRTGEAVRVFVVARDARLSADVLQAYCRERLTAYKVPRQFEFRETLPKSAVGKVLRRALR
ncbi:hypothetical protein PQR42_28315 [Paraburkholderia sediminicola]|uniref:AMP-binding enzyme n=1 Tax=Paraburkholderia sediminicola TaxID=458836 RepID=UPI0038B78A3D